MKTLLFRSIVILALSACTTTSKVSSLNGLPDLPENATGVAIPVSLESAVNRVMSGCTLSFRKGNSFKVYDIDFKPGKDVIFGAVPAGTYSFKEFSCGGREWDLTFESMAAFQVYENKISFVQGLIFTVGDDDVLHFGITIKELTREEAARLFGRVSASNRERIVSGYTGKEIP